MKTRTFLTACAVIAMANVSRGQSTTGDLEGWILDANRQPIPGANVSVSSPDLQGIRGSATDAAGHFQIALLPAGVYSARISHLAYRQTVVNEVRIRIGQTTTLGEFVLTSRTIEQEEVVVLAGEQLIDPHSAANGMNLATEQFSSLPVERSFSRLPELLPGLDQSSKGDGTNVAGATGIENKYFIDGSDVTDPATGAASFDLPYNFVREIDVRTGGYEAEYLSALGGVVNSVTYSGGNDFHGSVFGFMTNNNFNRQPRLAAGVPPRGKYADYETGLTLGGPLIRDRLWFYAAYDPHLLSEDVPVTGLGSLTSHSTSHSFAGKLTWEPDAANQLTLAICGNPQTGRDISSMRGFQVLNPDACSSDYVNNRISAIFNGVHIPSEYLTLESSLSAVYRRSSTAPISALGATMGYRNYDTRIVSGGIGGPASYVAAHQVSAGIKATLRLPDHSVKMGVAYSEISSEGAQESDVLVYLPGYFERYVTSSRGGTISRLPSAFVQDSWQVSPRFLVNAGVRWDPQWLIASDGSLAQRITDQVQPRAGIVFLPGELGRQKITASFGRFYEQVLMALPSSYHLKDATYLVTDYPNDPRSDASGAIFLGNLTPFVTQVPGLKGQYFDEITLGYERQIFTGLKGGVRGIHRWLGQGIEDGVVSPADSARYGSVQVYGNPGSAPLSDYPRMTRRYSALVFTIERSAPGSVNFLISYVLSRNEGNYDGFAETYDAPLSLLSANVTNQFGNPQRLVNADGLLPNDRPHVLKVLGSYAFDFGLSVGMTFQWMSGTPLNEFGADSTIYGAPFFLQQRGTAGRTPSIWDLNFRFVYNLSSVLGMGLPARVMLDLLHVGSRREVLNYDQIHYYDWDKQYVNRNFMQPTQFQSPMGARLGVEVLF